MKNTLLERVILGLLLLFPLVLPAQEPEPDSVASATDSMLQGLRNQIRELQMQGILMREEIERSERSMMEDSIRQARRRARVDSLRKITPGCPLVVDGDTLFSLYARHGGMLPESRVEEARKQILHLGKRLTFFADSIYVYESDFTTDVMSGNDVVLSLTDNDGLWQSTSRQDLAQQYAQIIQAKVVELNDEYGLRQKLMGLLMICVIIAVQVFLIWLTNRLYRRWRIRLARKLTLRARPLKIKDYEVLDAHRQGLAVLWGFRLLRFLFILLQLLISIPLLFSAFPETKSLTYRVFGYIWDPLTEILGSVLAFLPNLFKIVVIFLCFRYLVRGIHYLLKEIAEGRLKINGFYADWAEPTFYIVRLLCYSFMLVMIWPLLPSSNSQIFQGVSVFIGIIVSLGSSSIIGNIMAGMVMTYMRPFRLGDFIRFGDKEGFVIEKTVLVTRIRTRKNEVVTIPNSNLMGSQTSNFTFAAQNYGVIVHTKVTIGYDMEWTLIRDLLLAAASDTPGIQSHPKPFVLVTALDDFYVEYEINAFTQHSEILSDIYSSLHQNILDRFHSNGVEIMSPHIFAHRNDLEVQIPKKDLKS